VLCAVNLYETMNVKTPYLLSIVTALILWCSPLVNAQLSVHQPLSINSVSKATLADDFKIVSLAPHLTEWVYSLGLEKHLVAVSDYSDYPQEATLLPSVADYQGADIAAILALQPDLVLAWNGGNKPQDIQKLRSFGVNVFSSKITTLEDIPSELMRLAAMTYTEATAKPLIERYSNSLKHLRAEYYNDTPVSVFYYSWTSPLMSVGKNAWANRLLNVCGAQTLFIDSPVDYPQVSLKDVLVRQPSVLVAASKTSLEELEVYWETHRGHLKAPLLVVNPDVTSRFSLRLINELKLLCKGINENA
jgi:vitamin B12 transport system substrate-binding protein